KVVIILNKFSSLADITTLAAAPTTPGDAVKDVSSWWPDPNTREWLINRPIAIGITIVVALILQWILRRVINKLAQSSIEKKGSRSNPISKIGIPGANNKKQKATQEKQPQCI